MAAVAVTVIGSLTATPAPAAKPRGYGDLQAALDSAVAAGAPGMVAEVRRGDGHWWGSAGLSDTSTGRARQPQEHFRIGSTTKTFTAVVVLQLVAEHRLSLDDTVERWLPGLVDGNGYDGSRITIRELLNHTSGIFPYTNDQALAQKGIGTAWFAHRYDHYSPTDLVKIAVGNPPTGQPSARFDYSNTDYILAAMIVEKATGHRFEDELNRRIIRPLALTGTYLPGDDPTIRGPYPVHYSILFSQDPNPTVYDATDMNQSFAWTAGGMISTTGDLSRFFSALLAGRLLPPAIQREMFTTVDTSGSNWIPDTRYGLGVFQQTLDCGVTVWGNGGATYGSWSYVMGNRDGSHLVASEVNGDWSGLGVFSTLLNTEFCPAS
jgi:D-alanyl-D-alanine carboxypeptidase